jgi:putative transposase
MLTVQQREMVVKLKFDGKTQQQIAALIGCSQAAVSKTVARYEAGRTLETLSRSGRPTKLTDMVLKKVKRRLLSEVLDANRRYCSLSTKQLGDLIKEEVGRQYSIRHVERTMHRLGFSLVKPRPRHLKQDPKRVEKFREEFKKNLGRSTWVLSS